MIIFSYKERMVENALVTHSMNKLVADCHVLFFSALCRVLFSFIIACVLHRGALVAACIGGHFEYVSSPLSACLCFLMILFSEFPAHSERQSNDIESKRRS